jgi:hypothetical protein
MRYSKLFAELKKPISLVVKTRSPEKYLLVDRENGTIFVGNYNGTWDRLDPVTTNS